MADESQGRYRTGENRLGRRCLSITQWQIKGSVMLKHNLRLRAALRLSRDVLQDRLRNGGADALSLGSPFNAS